MSDKIQKVLDAFQNYKETTNNIIRDYPDIPNNSQLTYKELKDDEILSLDMPTIKEYLERMEQIRNNQEELLELMYEDLGSLLYVYAVQNEDYELLYELLDNDIDMWYAINDFIHNFRPAEEGIYMTLIYVLAQTYVWKQDYNISGGQDIALKHYEFSGPLLQNISESKMLELIVMILEKYIKRDEMKIVDMQDIIDRTWTENERYQHRYRKNLLIELLFKSIEKHINYEEDATLFVAKESLKGKLPNDVLNYVLPKSIKKGNGKGKRKGKKKTNKTKKNKKKGIKRK